MTWKCLPAWSKWTTLASIVYLCCFSSSSKSQMLVPSSTLAGRLTVAGVRQHPIDQRRLAGRAVAAEDKVANIRPGVMGMSGILVKRLFIANCKFSSSKFVKMI